MLKALTLAGTYLGFRSLLYRTVLPEDCLWSLEELCLKKGYKVETHWVTSKDGYILRLFRIGKEKISSGPPIMLVHGMTGSSNVFTVKQSAIAPAFLLANNDSDVWLLNTRGNNFSRLHTTLSARDPKYWDWTAHEIALGDIPASIDYVLACTKYHQINYLGHSQGGHVLLNCLSYLPQYNSKINLAALFAPVGGNITAQSRYFRKNISDTYTSYLELRGKNFIADYDYNGSFQAKFAHKFPEYAKKAYKERYDVDLNNDNPLVMKYYMQKISGGTSVTNLKYYAQLYKNRSPLPVAYDYGSKEKNIAKYGQPTPPRADFGQINAKLAIFFGAHDQICTKKDGEKLVMQLPKENLVYKELDCKQDHGGFLLSNNQQHMLKVIELIGKYKINK